MSERARNNKKSYVKIKNCMFPTVEGVVLGHFIKFIQFGKNGIVQEWGSEYQKWTHLSYHDGFEFSDLENPIDTTSSNWAISIKLQKNLPLLYRKGNLPIFDDFQILQKCLIFE